MENRINFAKKSFLQAKFNLNLDVFHFEWSTSLFVPIKKLASNGLSNLSLLGNVNSVGKMKVKGEF